MPANMVVNFFQHQVPGFNGGPIRIKGGKARGNQIRVDKNGAVRLVGQKLPGKGGFAGAVQSGDDEDSAYFASAHFSASL